MQFCMACGRQGGGTEHIRGHSFTIFIDPPSSPLIDYDVPMLWYGGQGGYLTNPLSLIPNVVPASRYNRNFRPVGRTRYIEQEHSFHTLFRSTRFGSDDMIGNRGSRGGQTRRAMTTARYGFEPCGNANNSLGLKDENGHAGLCLLDGSSDRRDEDMDMSRSMNMYTGNIEDTGNIEPSTGPSTGTETSNELTYDSLADELKEFLKGFEEEFGEHERHSIWYLETKQIIHHALYRARFPYSDDTPDKIWNEVETQVLESSDPTSENDESTFATDLRQETRSNTQPTTAKRNREYDSETTDGVNGKRQKTTGATLRFMR